MSAGSLWALAAVVVFVPLSTVRAATIASTTTTTYEYNADGAPTAVTTQIDGGAPSTVYLTWDNFVPDAADPSSGTVHADDGNLSAVGDSPSSTATVYQFDRRNRLVGYAAGGQALTYTYHPDGTMASSTMADDQGFSFYYDGGGLPRMLNQRQASDGLWSAHLGPLRHVNDGSEQILMTPRKDAAGDYDAAAETLSAYRYDAFGAETAATAAASYDIHDNPHRYAGEYRDAISQAQYLRARWYDARVPTFLSRDPLAQQNRYGYADANPVMMTDPGGMRASFGSGVVHGFDKAVDTLDSHWWGNLSRLFLSPVIYPMEIAAHPVRFWNGLRRDPVQIGFIIASGVAGVAGKLAGASLATLDLRQSAIGLGQAVFSGFDDARSKHFDATAFIDSAEMAVGVSLTPMLVGAARGFRSQEGFVHGLADIARERAGLVEEVRASVDSADSEYGGYEKIIRPVEGSYIIFHGREALANGINYTNPYLDGAGLGMHNDVLVAVGFDDGFVAGLVGGKAEVVDLLPIGGEQRDLPSALRQLSKRPDAEPDFTFRRVRRGSYENLLTMDDVPASSLRGRLAGGWKSAAYVRALLRHLRDR